MKEWMVYLYYYYHIGADLRRVHYDYTHQEATFDHGIDNPVSEATERWYPLLTDVLLDNPELLL